MTQALALASALLCAAAALMTLVVPYSRRADRAFCALVGIGITGLAAALALGSFA